VSHLLERPGCDRPNDHLARHKRTMRTGPPEPVRHRCGDAASTVERMDRPKRAV
jgi:hypothetical protein